MPICVIFNPAARGDKARRFREEIERIQHERVLKPTDAAGAARALAAESVRAGCDTIVAAGGDGTVNEVLNGMGDVPGAFAGTRLGVLPLGTINVFALELGVPTSFRGAWDVITRGKEIAIDLPRAEFRSDGSAEQRFFIQLGGAGLDARAVHLVSWELKKRIGFLAYFAAGLKAMQMARAEIVAQTESDSAAGELVLIGNGRFYGGRLPVFRTADFQDGLLDACVFSRINWFTLIRFFWTLVAGRKPDGAVQKNLRGSTIRLEGNSEALLELDGELVGHLPARLSMHPEKLRVIVP